MTKTEIRSIVLKKRGAIGADNKAKKDLAIKERLLKIDEVKNAKAVFLYASFKTEVDTLSLINDLLKAGKKIILPRVEGAELGLYEIKDPAKDLGPGMMGIPEPVEGARVADVNEADVVIVPGVAFDDSGGRLGYGKGFYDKLLARRAGNSKIPLIALAYEEQIWEDPLPLDPHDIKMDCVVTEKREIWTAVQ